MRTRELDRNAFAVLRLDPIVRVILLDEVPGATDGRRIEDVEQEFGSETERILPGRLVEASSDRWNPGIGKDAVVADKIREQIVKIPEGVVDRSSAHHHHLFW